MMNRSSGALDTVLLMLILPALLAGCGESGILDLYNVQGQIEIQSISPGSVVPAGEAIPVSVISDDSYREASSIDLTLYSREGETVDSWNLPVGDWPSMLETDGLDPGYYLLDVRVLDSSSGELESLELPFFVSASPGAIKGISAYPSAARPKEGMIFFADLDFPEGSDPYLRWSADGRVISAGSVSEGARLISWRVPENEGIYPVTAELFPVAPPGNKDFPFPATERFKIEAFVSTDPHAPRGELGPSDSFASLFHFRGSFDSSGYLTLPEARVQGQPELAVEAGIFGYRFSGEDALLFSGTLLPHGEAEQPPFSVELKGLFRANGAVYSLKNRRGEDVLVLQRDEEGFSLRTSDSRTIFPLADELLEAPRYLAFSLEMSGNRTRVRWYLDGQFMGSNDMPPLSFPSGRVSSVLGGGFSGLLDEFGVYSRLPDGTPAADPGIFAYAMRERYGRLLILAEGFDAVPSPGFFLPGSSPVRVRAEESSLIIPAGGRVGVPVALDGAPDGRIRLGFASSPAPPRLSFRIGESESESFEPVQELDGSVSLSWRRSSGRLELLAGGIIVSVLAPDSSEKNLELWFSAEEEPAALDWLVISRGEARIAAQAEGGVSPPEA
jgi:hypothetical protein